MEKNGESKGNLRSAQKIFRRMKILAFFMLVWLIQVKGEVYSQNQLVTLQLKNCNVEEFLQEVKNQTGIRFMYRSEFVRDIPRFSLDVRQERLYEVLKQVFAAQGIRMMLMIMMMQMILQMTGRKNSVTVIMMMDTMMPMITGRTRWTIEHLEHIGQMI